MELKNVYLRTMPSSPKGGGVQVLPEMAKSQGLSSLEPRARYEPLYIKERGDMEPRSRATRMFPGRKLISKSKENKTAVPAFRATPSARKDHKGGLSNGLTTSLLRA